jgi:hypothetical protein
MRYDKRRGEERRGEEIPLLLDWYLQRVALQDGPGERAQSLSGCGGVSLAKRESSEDARGQTSCLLLAKSTKHAWLVWSSRCGDKLH